MYVYDGNEEHAPTYKVFFLADDRQYSIIIIVMLRKFFLNRMVNFFLE